MKTLDARIQSSLYAAKVMPEATPDLQGRKAILAFLGLKVWHSVETRIERGAPIAKDTDGTWCAHSAELGQWEYLNMIRKDKE